MELIWEGQAVKRALCVLALVGVTGLMAVQPEARAQAKVKVLSDGPLQPALGQIGEAFRRDSGHQVEFVFGPSRVVHKKVADGETADVLIIQPNFVAELVTSGKVVAGDHPVISRVGVGLAARAETPAHDIGTAGALRQVLLNADALLFNTVASGNQFATVLERLSIAEAVKAKVVRLPPGPAIFEGLLQGKGDDIAVGTRSLIKATKGVRLIGPLPAELQSYLVYAAAPMRGAASPQAAKTFIAFLASPAARALFAANGVE